MNARRPSVARGSVTTPSITAQNAIRESLAAPRSPERATDILSKVCCAPAMGAVGQKAPDLLRLPMGNEMMGRRRRANTIESQSSQETDIAPSDCYFSFPSFENWDETKSEQSRDVFG